MFPDISYEAIDVMKSSSRFWTVMIRIVGDFIRRVFEGSKEMEESL